MTINRIILGDNNYISISIRKQNKNFVEIIFNGENSFIVNTKDKEVFFSIKNNILTTKYEDLIK